jgi:2-amino-4-hydroxy-6-hydroxymethyldihydropteridine diphosphokinase/dihydropteroate synthase
MVILGLGTNLNDRMQNLRDALALIKKIPQLEVKQVSPLYTSDALLPDNAPMNWDKPYFNLALRCETTLTPYELLQQTKNIEIKVGRTPEKTWGPRVIDIDILAWDDLIQYDAKLHIPHEHLHTRPFALWPLADVAPHWMHPILQKTAAELVLPWGSRFTGDAPLHTKHIPHRIDTPQLVGILNVTPDSFSDGGSYVDEMAALQHFQSLADAGAEIIDIGAESTGPHAQSISPGAEWQRLEPILKAVLSESAHLLIPPKISVDTRHAFVAEKALRLNVDWINDVSGLNDPQMCELVAAQTCDVVVMHHLGIPVEKERILPRHVNSIDHLAEWMEKEMDRLAKFISLERIIFDVGIGYGKSPEQSLELIKSVNAFKRFNVRTLVGHSRKSFLQQFTAKSAKERDLETLVLSLYLANQEVDYLRVHHVEAHSQGFKVLKSLI